jgi:hypothetical protein
MFFLLGGTRQLLQGLGVERRLRLKEIFGNLAGLASVVNKKNLRAVLVSQVDE